MEKERFDEIIAEVEEELVKDPDYPFEWADNPGGDYLREAEEWLESEGYDVPDKATWPYIHAVAWELRREQEGDEEE